MDGAFGDRGWAGTSRAEGFVQKDPEEGRPPHEATWVCVAYDDAALYFFINASDSQPERIRGQITSRDEWVPNIDNGRAFNQHSDFVEVWLDPQNDGVTAYAFTVNAAGIQVDARYSSAGTTRDPVWSGVWESAVSRSQDGWTAELRIPFSQLRYDADELSWGVQFVRYLYRENEISVFSPTPKGELRPLRYTAQLRGIERLPASRSVELIPYGVVALESDRGELAWRTRAGGDARIVLGAASVMQLSLFPDFGQVEQDPSELNLTAYETFRTERRQFFVDGQELFAYPILNREATRETLYYSRRIGAAPVLDLGLAQDQIVDAPRETSIIGAAKFMGRAPGGFGYSVLNAVTARERATVRVDGVESRPAIASPANYSVLRLRQELGSGSSIGAMATNVYRSLDPEVASGSARLGTAGALDFDLRLGDWGALGNVVGSRVAGSAAALDKIQRSSAHYLHRPDATHLRYDPSRPEMTGYAFGVNAGKLSGAPWLAWVGLQVRDPNLELNDFGYLRNADQQSLYGNVTWRDVAHSRLYNILSVATTAWYDRTFGHELTSRGVMTEAKVGFANGWGAYFGASRRTEAFDVTLLRGGPAFLEPGGWGSWWGLGTDVRKPFSALFEGSGDYGDERSLRGLRLSLKLSVRPHSALSASVLPAYQVSTDDLQYVDVRDGLAGPEPILGRLSRETLSVTLRVSWALARGLTVEAYAMPYLSAGNYDAFYAVRAPGARRYADRRVPVFDYSGVRNFLAAEIRSNVVLRWDYLPGSALYLAWAHEQSQSLDSDGLDTRRLDPVHDLRALFGTASSDAVFLKLAYYLDL